MRVVTLRVVPRGEIIVTDWAYPVSSREECHHLAPGFPTSVGNCPGGGLPALKRLSPQSFAGNVSAG